MAHVSPLGSSWVLPPVPSSPQYITSNALAPTLTSSLHERAQQITPITINTDFNLSRLSAITATPAENTAAQTEALTAYEKIVKEKLSELDSAHKAAKPQTTEDLTKADQLAKHFDIAFGSASGYANLSKKDQQTVIASFIEKAEAFLNQDEPTLEAEFKKLPDFLKKEILSLVVEKKDHALVKIDQKLSDATTVELLEGKFILANAENVSAVRENLIEKFEETVAAHTEKFDNNAPKAASFERDVKAAISKVEKATEALEKAITELNAAIDTNTQNDPTKETAKKADIEKKQQAVDAAEKTLNSAYIGLLRFTQTHKVAEEAPVLNDRLLAMVHNKHDAMDFTAYNRDIALMNFAKAAPILGSVAALAALVLRTARLIHSMAMVFISAVRALFAYGKENEQVRLAHQEIRKIYAERIIPQIGDAALALVGVVPLFGNLALYLFERATNAPVEADYDRNTRRMIADAKLAESRKPVPQTHNHSSPVHIDGSTITQAPITTPVNLDANGLIQDALRQRDQAHTTAQAAAVRDALRQRDQEHANRQRTAINHALSQRNVEWNQHFATTVEAEVQRRTQLPAPPALASGAAPSASSPCDSTEG